MRKLRSWLGLILVFIALLGFVVWPHGKRNEVDGRKALQSLEGRKVINAEK